MSSYPLVVQPLYIGADHPSYISKKVHKYLFLCILDQKNGFYRSVLPHRVSLMFPPHHFLPHSHHWKCRQRHHLMGGVLHVVNLR